MSVYTSFIHRGNKHHSIPFIIIHTHTHTLTFWPSGCTTISQILLLKGKLADIGNLPQLLLVHMVNNVEDFSIVIFVPTLVEIDNGI